LKKLRTIFAGIASSALLAVVLTPVAAQATLAVPKTTWPACDEIRVFYCIESISIRPLGTRTDIPLVWYDSGTGPEKIVDEQPPANSFIDGPEVIAPGQQGSFTLNLPELYAGVAAQFAYSGAGTADLTAGTAATATVSAGAGVEGFGTLDLFLDLDGNGRFTPNEKVASKRIAIGTQSVVGTGATETQFGSAVSGRWSHPRWQSYGLDAYGYDGLTIDLKTANQFTNHLFFTVYPVKASDSNATSIATRTDGTGLAANLNMDDRITIKVRTGEIITGVSIGIANSVSMLATPPVPVGDDDFETGTLTITGTPVPVPQIRSITQCEGSTSSATAVVNTMRGFIVVENDDMGFGVDGLSGRMAVASNGASCGISTPVWNDETQTLSWQAGAPHFEPDGVTTNKGFYKAVIPANDALLLWGLQDPTRAVTALTVQVTEETGGPAVAASKISYLHGNIIIDVTGFTFSRPTVTITKRAGATGFAQKRTLTCVDPATKARVTIANTYGCPTGPVPAFRQASLQRHTQATLNNSQRAQIKRVMANYREANKFICTGIYLEGATRQQMIDARRNAKQACDYAKSQDSTLSYWFQTRSTKAPAFRNSVLLVLKNEN